MKAIPNAKVHWWAPQQEDTPGHLHLEFSKLNAGGLIEQPKHQLGATQNVFIFNMLKILFGWLSDGQLLVFWCLPVIRFEPNFNHVNRVPRRLALFGDDAAENSGHVEYVCWSGQLVRVRPRPTWYWLWRAPHRKRSLKPGWWCRCRSRSSVGGGWGGGSAASTLGGFPCDGMGWWWRPGSSSDSVGLDNWLHFTRLLNVSCCCQLMF